MPHLFHLGIKRIPNRPERARMPTTSPRNETLRTFRNLRLNKLPEGALRRYRPPDRHAAQFHRKVASRLRRRGHAVNPGSHKFFALRSAKGIGGHSDGCQFTSSTPEQRLAHREATKSA